MGISVLHPQVNSLHLPDGQAAANDRQILTFSSIILNAANTLQGICLGLRNHQELDNNPFSSNRDYDKCFTHESPDRNRAFYKENCLFHLSWLLCESIQETRVREKQFRGRQVIIWKTAVFIAAACSRVCLLPVTEREKCPGWGEAGMRDG